MFIQTWNNYLPVIKILMKRSASGEQILNMNLTDFQRAAGGRKVKYIFNITLHKGRIQNIISPSPIAKDLLAALQQDDTTYKLIRRQDFDFSMNNSFQLSIKNITPPQTDTEPITDAESKGPETPRIPE
jgi:hypothetical protein